MSVLKNKRTISKAEYVNVAVEIYSDTLEFLTRLSARYARLMGEKTIALADEVMDNCIKANSHHPSDPKRREIREKCLMMAQGSLAALDNRLGICYQKMYQNPQGCFTTGKGVTVPPQKATEKLDSMAQNLGEKIDREYALLRSVMASDKKLS
jgi:hypothetical protein